MNRSLIKFSCILFLSYLLNGWLFYYAPFHIPAYIPSTPINISGLGLLISIAVVILYFQKQLLKKNSHLKVFSLTFLSAFACFIAEVAFQAIRFFKLDAPTFMEKLFYFFQGIIILPLFGAILAFFIALFLKRNAVKRQTKPGA